MKKQLLVMTCLLLSAGIAIAQSQNKLPVERAVPELTKVLNGTGLPFEMLNDSAAIIPYQGENIATYEVLVQKVSDLYIVYTNLSEVMPEKLNETQYKYLLKLNDHFDIVKIGLAEDGIFYLRADLYKSTASTPILERIISQVANVANIISGELE